jgi:hypothetical protein
MRKLFWCCAAAGVLVVGGLFSASYYAGRHPDTAFGRCVTTAAGASVVLQPATVIGPVVSKTVGHVLKPHGPAATTAAHDCIPDEPRPVDAAPAAGVIPVEGPAPEQGPDPIVIDEGEPADQGEALPMPSAVDMDGPPGGAAVEPCQEPDPACPMVMPYCTDDDEGPAPAMPHADEDQPARKNGEGGAGHFNPWRELFEDAEPRCQEDSHIHEHYSGCPYTGRKPGKEEASEEPVPLPKKPANKHGKGCKGDCTPTEGVDTMEYRRSDGGLNEYGPGPF